MKGNHISNIPSFLYDDLMSLFSRWMTSGKIERSVVEDVIDSSTSTKSGKELNTILDGKSKWFLRLDQMSPKDSQLEGAGPVSTLTDVIRKICSSMRAYGCLQSAKEDAEKGGTKILMQLILNPWDDTMDPAREFRVFVPPPVARGVREPCIGDFAISAISQYRWHHAFSAPYGLTVEEVVGQVEEGACKTLTELVEFIAAEMDAEIRALLLEYGFSFDVVLKEGGNVQLVEVNPFGAMSGCGACLFSWVADGKVLYGLEKAVFAMTLASDISPLS